MDIADFFNDKKKCNGCVKPKSMYGNCSDTIHKDDKNNCFIECPYVCEKLNFSKDFCKYDVDCSDCGITKFKIDCNGSLNEIYGNNTIYTYEDINEDKFDFDILLKDKSKEPNIEILINELEILTKDYSYLHDDYLNNLKINNMDSKLSLKQKKDLDELKANIDSLYNKIHKEMKIDNNYSYDIYEKELKISQKNEDRKDKIYSKLKLQNNYIQTLSNKISKKTNNDKKVLSSQIYLIFITLLLFFVIIITINSFNNDNISFISIITISIIVTILVYYNFNYIF